MNAALGFPTIDLNRERTIPWHDSELVEVARGGETWRLLPCFGSGGWPACRLPGGRAIGLDALRRLGYSVTLPKRARVEG